MHLYLTYSQLPAPLKCAKTGYSIIVTLDGPELRLILALCHGGVWCCPDVLCLMQWNDQINDGLFRDTNIKMEICFWHFSGLSLYSHDIASACRRVCTEPKWPGLGLVSDFQACFGISLLVSQMILSGRDLLQADLVCVPGENWHGEAVDAYAICMLIWSIFDSCSSKFESGKAGWAVESAV